VFEKHKTEQPFKLHFLQNSPRAKLNISASDCKDVGSVQFCEILFSSSVAFLMMSVASQKRRSCNVDFSLGKGYKSAGATSEVGKATVLSHCSLLRNL
jgi:hypothetical protein